MTDYVYLGNQRNGKKGISTYVYCQIAQEAVQGLAQGNLAGQFLLNETKKGPKIIARVDKRNHVNIEIEISLIGEKDAQSCCAEIQKAVYEAIDDLLETPPSKVNVAVSRLAVKADERKQGK